MFKITKLSPVPVIFSIILLIIAVLVNGNIAKSKFDQVSNGGTILSELISQGILEEVSSTEVRLKADLELNKERIRNIADDDFDQVWVILQQSLMDGFYTFLRLVIFVTGTYLAFYFFSAGMNVWAWAIVFMALLFNPFSIVHLEKWIWQIVDIISAAVLGFIIIPVKIKNIALSIFLKFWKCRLVVGVIVISFLVWIIIYWKIWQERKQQIEEIQGKYENTFKVLDSLSNDLLGK